MQFYRKIDQTSCDNDRYKHHFKIVIALLHWVELEDLGLRWLLLELSTKVLQNVKDAEIHDGHGDEFDKVQDEHEGVCLIHDQSTTFTLAQRAKHHYHNRQQDQLQEGINPFFNDGARYELKQNKDGNRHGRTGADRAAAAARLHFQVTPTLVKLLFFIIPLIFLLKIVLVSLLDNYRLYCACHIYLCRFWREIFLSNKINSNNCWSLLSLF